MVRQILTAKSRVLFGDDPSVLVSLALILPCAVKFIATDTVVTDSDSDSRNLLSTKGEQQKNTVKEQFKT